MESIAIIALIKMYGYPIFPFRSMGTSLGVAASYFPPPCSDSDFDDAIPVVERAAALGTSMDAINEKNTWSVEGSRDGLVDIGDASMCFRSSLQVDLHRS